MFHPKTTKIAKLAEKYPRTIQELSRLFDKPTSVYIDFANVFHWSKKLKWHVDLKRLKQLLDSFDSIKNVKLYNGTLDGDALSESIIKTAQKCGYGVITKPVKKMRLTIDVSGIPNDSPTVLQNFIKKPLLRKFEVETIEYLNGKLTELNNRGITYVEHWKCNFDVEIGRDMYLDLEKNGIESFILWSGDSDFADPISDLLNKKKEVCIFATVRRVAPELAQTGIKIFELWKIKEFICWLREMK